MMFGKDKQDIDVSMLNADKKGNKNWTAQTGQYVLSSAHIEHKLCLSVRKHEDSGQNTQFHHRAGHDHASWSRLHLSLQPALALSLWPAGPHGHLQCCRLCGAAIFLPGTKPLQHRYCPDPQSAFDPEELLLCWFCGQPSAISRPQQKKQKTAVQPPDQTIKDACLHQGLQINPDARTGAGQKTQTRPLSPALLRNDHVWQNWACDYKAEWPRTSPDG